MASLWFEATSTDIHTTFSFIDEAYFFASRMFRTIVNVLYVEEKIHKNGFAYIGSDPNMQVYLYLNETPDESPFRSKVRILKEKLPFHYEIKSRMNSVVLPPRTPRTPRRLYPRLVKD